MSTQSVQRSAPSRRLSDRAKEAFHEGNEWWMRRLRFDGGSSPGNGGGLGGSPLLA